MAQRDYISSKNRPARHENRRNTPVPHREARGKSPYILIAIILLILMIFVGGLYFIINNAPEEVAKQVTQTSEALPPPPMDKWQYINDLESGSRPVNDSILDASSLEQEALNALISQQIDPATGQIIANPLITAQEAPVDSLGNQLEGAANALNTNAAGGVNNDPYAVPTTGLVQSNELEIPASNATSSSTISELENELASLPSNVGTPSSSSDGTKVIPQPSDQEAQIKKQAEQEKILKEQNAKKEEQARLKRLAAEEKARKEREAKALAQSKPQVPRTTSPNVISGRGWQLQCGSFVDAIKAEGVKAQLAFKGIQANVVKAGQYNRVMLGPFNSKQDANNLNARTKAAGVSGCIILAP